LWRFLQRVFALFLSSNTNCTLNAFNEDFAIANFAGVRTANNAVDASV